MTLNEFGQLNLLSQTPRATPVKTVTMLEKYHNASLFFNHHVHLLSLRMRTSTCLRSRRATASLPWVSLTTVLTSGPDLRQRTTAMRKTDGKGKCRRGNDIVPGTPEVATVRGDKQGGTRVFPL